MRAAQKYQNQYQTDQDNAKPIRPSTAKPKNNSPKRIPRPRTAHSTIKTPGDVRKPDNLTIKSIYSVHNSPSKVDR